MMTGMLLSSGFSFELGEHGHAIHDGHGDVEDDEIRFLGGGGSETFRHCWLR